MKRSYRKHWTLRCLFAGLVAAASLSAWASVLAQEPGAGKSPEVLDITAPLPGLQALDPEECLKRLPPVNRVPADPDDSITDYTPRRNWERFRELICSRDGEAAKDPALQSCIVAKISSGKYGPQNAHLVWNTCVPSVQSCKKDSSAIAARLSAPAEVRKFMQKEFCPQASGSNPRELACMISRARKSPELMKDTRLLWSLCIDPARDCVEKVSRHFGVVDQDRERLGTVSSLCQSFAQDHEAGKCQISLLVKTGLHDRSDLGFSKYVCSRDHEATRGCLAELSMRPDLATEKKDNAQWLNRLQAICESPAVLRECVIASTRGGRHDRDSLSIAKVVCQFPDEERRFCMKDALAGKAPFGAGVAESLRRELDRNTDPEGISLRALRDSGNLALQICEFSREKDRSCMAKFVNESLIKNPNSYYSAIEGAREECIYKSKEYSECLASGKALPLNEIHSILGVVPFDIQEICRIPNSDIQACVVNGLHALVSRYSQRRGNFLFGQSDPFQDLKASCESQALQGLLKRVSASSQPNPCYEQAL